MNSMSTRFLYGFVFINGAAVMMLEFAASRLLAPWFGTSMFVWGNVIGVILVALSLGYYFGGKLADRYPQPSILMMITLGAGLFSCILPILVPALARQVSLLAILNTSAIALSVFGSFIVITILFAIPVGLLGMVSPYAIRLATSNVKQSGAVAGTLYAASTMGSIVGTFLSSFVLVPLLGSRETLLLAAASLLLIAVIGYRRWWLASVLLIPIIMYGAYHGTLLRSDTNVVMEDESVYQFIQVQDQSDRLALIFNEGLGTQSYYMKSGVLTHSYYDYISLTPQLLSSPQQAHIAILGLAGGTISREFRHFFPQSQITGVELDPQVIAIAQEYFHLDEQNIKVVNNDARQFMQHTSENYDLIVLDAFANEFYIPWHLTTQEFFQTIHQHIKPGGIVAFNIGSTTEDSTLLQAMIATLYTSFENVYIMPVPESLNYVVMATDTPIISTQLQHITDERADIATIFEQSIERVSPPTKVSILTDNRAPIELYTETMVYNYLRNYYD